MVLRREHLPWLLAGLALWLLTHPYAGIWHDARFYTVMALRRLHPSAFASDPWFAFGSQDQFSVFSALYAPIVDLLDIAAAAMALTLVGAASYLAGCWWICQRFLQGRSGFLAFLILASVPLPYCPNNWEIFVISESFGTARPIAVGASLVGMAMYRDRRPVGASCAFAVGLAVHPLMTIGAVAVSVIVGLRNSTVAWTAAAILALLSAAVLADVKPLAPMDEMWLGIVDQSGLVVTMPGPHYDASLALLALAWLAFAARMGSDRNRRWYVAALVVGLYGWGTSLAASRWYPAQAVLAVQPWRALWIVLAIWPIAVVDVLSRWSIHSARVRFSVLGAVVASVHFPVAGAWAMLVWVPLSVALERTPRSLLPTGGSAWLRVACWVSLTCVAIGLPAWWLQLAMLGVAPPEHLRRTDIAILDGLLLTGGFGAMAAAMWIAGLLLADRLRASIAWTCVAIASVALAGLFWDARPPAIRTAEARFSTDALHRPFRETIATGDVVYWRDGGARTWFQAGTSSYASSMQAVGVVFSRDFAMEIRRRLGRIATIGLDDDALLSRALGDDERLDLALSKRKIKDNLDLHRYEPVEANGKPLSAGALQYLCMDGELRWIIDWWPVEGWISGKEVVEVKPGRVRPLFLYDCDHVRSRAT